MGVTVEKFDPAHAPEAELRAFHEVMTARYADDRPRWTAPAYEEVLFRLRTPFQGLGPSHRWSARLDGETAGFAELLFADWEHAALLEIVVHPRARRRGVGTAVLQALLPEVEARGRTQLEGWQITKDSDGARWASNRGFRTVNTNILQTLTLAEADSTLWDVPIPPGYRLVQWTGRTPDELLSSYAAARNAIHDAPMGEQNVPLPQWTPERIREAEQDYLDRGAEQRVVVAVHEASGAVAGMTELELHSERPGRGFQQDTCVVPAHRGRGLGRCMKAHMIRWTRSERPAITEIATGTSGENVHMARVNHALGYVTVSDMIAVSAKIEELSA
ncbi:GNAT family N-acetyltransferase [Lentzea sp. BCCO 10_0856]|uniref:GNAT family N-acetyltransferase n=1 Tax=Lentzea miocenica TaxID=3095431 RepID=A0ABU4T5L5_9PSEU|nr:GNAT family N-acetyltransferase [Lentzea sp. BCCO 10_0856]MDX8033466.1 GNAT family N-acetyltransferase [Lentzea sp. BCCO 10_0856]